MAWARMLRVTRSRLERPGKVSVPSVCRHPGTRRVLRTVVRETVRTIRKVKQPMITNHR